MSNAKIRLGILKQSVTVSRFGKVSLEIKDNTVYVEFVALDGRSVSVAFNGREKQSGPVTDLSFENYPDPYGCGCCGGPIDTDGYLCSKCDG